MPDLCFQKISFDRHVEKRQCSGWSTKSVAIDDGGYDQSCGQGSAKKQSPK